jgi:hypothetical protein
MRSHGGPPQIGPLKTQWCRWVEIVETFARRRPGRCPLDPQTYAVLHKEIIQACRTLTESATEADQTFYRNLEELVQPWVTLSALARTDSDILIDLVVRCREVERRLGVSSWRRPVRDLASRAPVVPLAIAVGIIVIGASIGGWHWSLDRLRGWSDDLWFAVKQSSEVERLCVVGVVLIIVSIMAVSRTARS